MEKRLLARLEALAAELEQVEEQLATTVEPARIAGLGRRHSELAHIASLFQAWKRAEQDRREASDLAAGDPALATELLDMAEERRSDSLQLEEQLRQALVPTDPLDDKDVIVEIRAAAGGEEAAIWAGDLMRMYEHYADRHRLKVEGLESNESGAGGFSRVTLAIKGKGAYSRMKWEAGVHRVQRVPATESQGRVHTSTATVAVLPEAEEVDVVIEPQDVRVDVFRSTGPGGQSVNTTDSAIRLTHLPTGLTVSCQDEKSQLQNKEKAFRILRARLYQMRLNEQQAALAETRRDQVRSGDRSEKIRTYNFKESRVTDHRVGLVVYRLPAVLEGDLDELVEAVASADRAERLAGEQ